ncbi:hypothetical protein IPJ72_05820 [Candidatus Peregrinibacteria bacterium]|nr:MAG: hypothetical protein IPJ72_05820 [Candidatus Peregrinibacteria bacterium]
MDELPRFIESHAVVEIKSTGPIPDLKRLLKRLKLTEQPFSKYCIGSHLLKPTLKANPWRRTLKVLQVT